MLHKIEQSTNNIQCIEQNVISFRLHKCNFECRGTSSVLGLAKLIFLFKFEYARAVFTLAPFWLITEADLTKEKKTLVQQHFS